MYVLRTEGGIEQGSALADDQVNQLYAYLNVDIYRLNQVVRNLVSNAVASFAVYAAVQSDLNYLMVINLSGQVYTLQRYGDHRIKYSCEFFGPDNQNHIISRV